MSRSLLFTRKSFSLNCVVCDRPLPPGRFVIYEIGGLSSTQHVECFARGLIHAYRVLKPDSSPVFLSVSSEDFVQVCILPLDCAECNFVVQVIQNASLMCANNLDRHDSASEHSPSPYVRPISHSSILIKA